jgi:hypothetical protein
VKRMVGVGAVVWGGERSFLCFIFLFHTLDGMGISRSPLKGSSSGSWRVGRVVPTCSQKGPLTSLLDPTANTAQSRRVHWNSTCIACYNSSAFIKSICACAGLETNTPNASTRLAAAREVLSRGLHGPTKTSPLFWPAQLHGPPSVCDGSSLSLTQGDVSFLVPHSHPCNQIAQCPLSLAKPPATRQAHGIEPRARRLGNSTDDFQVVGG